MFTFPFGSLKDLSILYRAPVFLLCTDRAETEKMGAPWLDSDWISVAVRHYLNDIVAARYIPSVGYKTEIQSHRKQRGSMTYRS